MLENFDIWNTQKKDIDSKEIHRWCKERDIWWCTLGTNIGFEQNGKGEKYLRPVVVLKNFGIFTALVIPLTSSLKKNTYHTDLGLVLGRQAFAIITQIRLIDTKRMVEKEGKVSEDIFIKLKDSIIGLLK